MSYANELEAAAVEFSTEQAARDYRAGIGGWIFASDCGGRFIRFPVKMTIGAIFREPQTRGLSGRII